MQSRPKTLTADSFCASSTSAQPSAWTSADACTAVGVHACQQEHGASILIEVRPGLGTMLRSLACMSIVYKLSLAWMLLAIHGDMRNHSPEASGIKRIRGTVLKRWCLEGLAAQNFRTVISFQVPSLSKIHLRAMSATGSQIDQTRQEQP